MKLHHLLLLVLPACLDSKKGSEPDRDLSEAICDYQLRCGYIGASERASCVEQDYVAPIFLDGLSIDPDPGYDIGAGLDAGRIRFSKDADARCRAALAGRCQDVTELMQCRLRYEGRVTPGATCNADVECLRGHCEMAGGKSGDDGCPGVCSRELALGDACDAGGICPDGASCAFATGTCTRNPGVGEPCNATGVICAAGLLCIGETCSARRKLGEPCGSGLFESLDCEVELTCIDGICSAKGGEGERCASSTGLGGLGGLGGTGLLCQDGFYCDSGEDPPICHALIADGEACAAYGQCRDSHPCIGLVNGQTPGHCGPWVDRDDACPNDADFTGCPFSMACSGTCTPKALVAGAPCDSTCNARGELYCEAASHTCQPVHALGDACTEPVDLYDTPCAAGSCSSTTSRCELVCE